MKYSFSFLALLYLAMANGQTTVSESDEVKEHLIKLEKQSWRLGKTATASSFRIFIPTIMSKSDLVGQRTRPRIVALVGSPVCAVKSYKLDRFEMKMFDKETALLTYWEEQDTVCNKPVPSPCWVSSL